MPVIGALARVWPALRNRLVANKRLPIQIGVELTVGFVTKTLAELRGRGDKFWREFDFYLSDIALELVGDAMLVWLLSPTAVFASTARKSGIGGTLLHSRFLSHCRFDALVLTLCASFVHVVDSLLAVAS